MQPKTYELGEDLYGTTRIYTRCSSLAQEEDASEGGFGEPSTASQQHELYALAQTIPCGHIEDPTRYCDSGRSATKTRLEERPGIQLLLTEVRRGDLVVVWSLERAVRGSFEVAALLRLLAERGVSVLSKVQFGTTPLKLDGMMAVLWASAMDMANAIDFRQRSEALKRFHRYYRRNGLYAGHARALRRVQPVIVKGKTVRRLVWDDHECDLACEMAHRRWVLGEQCQDIYADFVRRGEKTHDGRLIGVGKLGKKGWHVEHERPGKPKYRVQRTVYNVWVRPAWRVMKLLRELGLSDPRQLHPGTDEPLVDARNAESA
ncbi:MAG TPA: recombinase family protein [Pirellulales bacterium]|nr:recombinase family protein [Pirellulales bacterium]